MQLGKKLRQAPLNVNAFVFKTLAVIYYFLQISARKTLLEECESAIGRNHT